MPIRFTCPNPQCGKTIVVKDEFAGRTGKCPGCATPVKIPTAMPAFEVVEDEPDPTPPPKKKVAAVVVDETKEVHSVKAKTKPVIVVEEDEEVPTPKKRPVVVDETKEAHPAKAKTKSVIVVEDAEEVPSPLKPKPAPAATNEPEVWDVTEAVDDAPPATLKKVAPARSRDADEDEPAPAKKSKVPNLRKPADLESLDDEILNRAEWLVREIASFVGNTRAGLFESPESKKPYAVVRDATYKVFGFLNVDVMGFRPRFKFQLRRDDKDGDILLTLERFIPTFDMPFATPKPVRWEVRGPDDGVVGSVTLSRAGFSFLKLVTKGQFFQDEHFVLDADGGNVGSIHVERGRTGAPQRMAIVDGLGNEYGSFSSQFGKKMGEAMDEVKRTGKTKVKVSMTVMGKGDEDERGIYGRVNPDRVGDPYSRVMTLAVAILLENLGYEAFMGAKSRKT